MALPDPTITLLESPDTTAQTVATLRGMISDEGYHFEDGAVVRFRTGGHSSVAIYHADIRRWLLSRAPNQGATTILSNTDFGRLLRQGNVRSIEVATGWRSVR